MHRAPALLALSALFCLTACQAPAAHGPYAFAIDVTLTPAAMQKLASLHETVAVQAFYAGLPAPGVQATPDGEVDLGSEKVEFTPPQGHVTFTGSAISDGDLKTISGKPRVLINVFSARHAAPDNVLDCTIFEDEIAVAQAQTPHITCDLIKPI